MSVLTATLAAFRSKLLGESILGVPEEVLSNLVAVTTPDTLKSPVTVTPPPTVSNLFPPL